jgi:hypothetical protein
MLQKKIDEIVSQFEKDPRNKIFVDFDTLVLSSEAETKKSDIETDLIKSIALHISGKLKESDYSILDGALSVCYKLADLCFKAKNKDNANYVFNWLKQNHGYSVEIRQR